MEVKLMVEDPAENRRQEALALAEELLADIELSRLAATEIARKTSRLARLLDDQDAMGWLSFEVRGYPDGPTLPGSAWAAAERSNRVFTNEKGENRANTNLVGQLQADVDGGLAQIAAATDPGVSVASANPHQIVQPPRGNTAERGLVRQHVARQKAVLDKVVGSFYDYAAARYQELRFGAAVETAFEVVRSRVDASIAALVPDAPAMLAAAFENAASDNPEHSSAAAATCRRLLKATADALRPPGDPVDGHPMTDSHYRNRLIDWVMSTAHSDTRADLIQADIEHLGARLEAVDDAGHKGAHASVDRYEAARFLTGTYLLLGDILDLAGHDSSGKPAETTQT